MEECIVHYAKQQQMVHVIDIYLLADSEQKRHVQFK